MPVDTEDQLSLSCGAVLDYRIIEQVLRPHADLWLTPSPEQTQPPTTAPDPRRSHRATTYCPHAWRKPTKTTRR
ncbi:hypothetical protein ACFVFQ_36955 [Streptomyces sp. NPDC057743]|uniref:hypothetical protein n=1 Tax=Streptomyces sp. NPDC057743 TaxID=3346236 RepID=UPI0036BFF28C